MRLDNFKRPRKNPGFGPSTLAMALRTFNKNRVFNMPPDAEMRITPKKISLIAYKLRKG